MTVLDIMLPYYGDVELMKLAVRSVLSQTDPRWHLTVVDDGRAEGVPEWFSELNHPQVRYERNERNLGLTGNFQRCLDLATRDHMVMMGCDDIMLPNYVSVVLELLRQHPQAVLVQPGVEVIGGDGQPVRTLVDETKRRIYAPRFTGKLVMGGEDLAVSLLRGDWLYFPSLCWRTKDVQSVGFDERLAVILDLAVILRLVEQGGELVVSDERCFQYRRHAVSASSSSAVEGSRFTEARDYFLEVAAAMDARGWRRAASTARWHLSSRLHAMTLMPTAARQRNMASLKTLAKYALGSSRG